jgi:hypothetical protein
MVFSLSYWMWSAKFRASCSITSQASSNGLEAVWVKTESLTFWGSQVFLSCPGRIFLSGLSSKLIKIPKSVWFEFTGVPVYQYKIK